MVPLILGDPQLELGAEHFIRYSTDKDVLMDLLKKAKVQAVSWVFSKSRVPF